MVITNGNSDWFLCFINIEADTMDAIPPDGSIQLYFWEWFFWFFGAMDADIVTIPPEVEAISF